MNRIESATGCVWEFPSGKVENLAAAIVRRHGLPELMGRVLAVRGVSVEEVPGFLSPRLDRLMPDPAFLADMPAASERLSRAVREGESIAVYGDYDVDGACSVAMLAGWLETLGRSATWQIPHRMLDGYGPNAVLLSELGSKHDLVVIVDSGSSLEAKEGIKAALENGADVIVADHHACEVPNAREFLFVNPNRVDDASGLECLCAAGVAFMLIVATARELRRAAWYETAGIEEPRLAGWLDLVALATVADAVPLEGINRALVRFGLREMRKQRRWGIGALLECTRVAGPITEHHLGWNLGPQLNAPGRIGAESRDPELPVRLLLASSATEARELAGECNAFNAVRRKAQERVLADIEASRCRGGESSSFAWFAEEQSNSDANGWHPGVVGIAAGRLADRLRRPVIVLARYGKAFKGSGRTFGDLDLGAAVRQVRTERLLTRGGGHRGAVGVEADAVRLDDAMERIGTLLEDSRHPGDDVRPRTDVVGAVGPRGITSALHEMLERAGPFGRGAPRPRFVLGAVRLRYEPRLLKETHYLLHLSDESGASVKAMAFGVAGTHLGEVLRQVRRGDLIDAMGEIGIDDYQGARKAYMRVEDIAYR